MDGRQETMKYSKEVKEVIKELKNIKIIPIKFIG